MVTIPFWEIIHDISELMVQDRDIVAMVF